VARLDSDTLITQALKRLGNETLTEDAQVWIYTILERLYEDYKWPFLEKVATGVLTPSQTSVNLPSDYSMPWDVDSFVVIDSNGGYHALNFFSQYDQDLIVKPSTTGTPRDALLDLNAMTWRPFPLPNTNYTWQVRYLYLPDPRPDTYANFTPVFPNDAIIIQALFVYGLQHEDDDRYAMEMKVLQGMISRFQGTFNSAPNKRQQVRLSRRFGQPQNFR
jgi:hypothetical protein